MPARPRVVAITGSIGSGKSLVGDILQKRGYRVIDTDAVVHHLFENSKELKSAILERFGPVIIGPNGSIDRTALAAIVFDDSGARRDLERIVHPAVLNECDRMLDTMSGDRPVFMLIPLLFETGLEKRYDEIWSVITNDAILRERLIKRRKMTADEVNRRLSAQLPQPEKARRSHRVINNSGTIAETEAQIDAILDKLVN
jgi:dephospho-CoA kinase